MKHYLKIATLCAALYGVGMLTGAGLTLALVFGRGEAIGARIIAVGVRLTQSGTVPTWTTAIEAPREVQPTPLRVATKEMK